MIKGKKDATSFHCGHSCAHGGKIQIKFKYLTKCMWWNSKIISLELTFGIAVSIILSYIKKIDGQNISMSENSYQIAISKKCSLKMKRAHSKTAFKAFFYVFIGTQSKSSQGILFNSNYHLIIDRVIRYQFACKSTWTKHDAFMNKVY